MPDNIQFICDWYRTRDVETYAAEDIEFDVMEGFIEGGRYRGRAEVAQFFERFMSWFSEFRPEIVDIIDAGRAVTTIGNYHGRLKHNGATVTTPFVHVWHLEDGLLARMVGFANGYIMQEAIGRPIAPGHDKAGE